MNRLKNSLSRFALSLALGAAFTIVPIVQAPSHAACNPTKPSGKAVGTINIGSTKMNIIPFNYPAGGVMEPQKTTEALFMSLRHMPLSSSIGTTVLAWHVNFNGCWNELNFLIGDEKVGFKFKITDETGVTKSYKISQVTVVKKGNYKKSWFTINGPRQLALFTCSGAFTNGHYVENKVIIAVPA